MSVKFHIPMSGAEATLPARSKGGLGKGRLRAMVVAGSLVMLTAGASASPSAPGRFTMTPTDDGMLRLDTLTGAVTMCRKASDNWKCEDVVGGQAVNKPASRLKKDSAPTYDYDDKDLYGKRRADSELQRLRRENRRLRALLASKGITAPPREKLELPSEEDVDKVIGFVERMIERFNGIVKKLQKEREEPGTPL